MTKAEPKGSLVSSPTAIVANSHIEETRQARLRPTRDPEKDPRSPARHDRDRIIYSRALLRLSGVTQVLTPSERGAWTHNRLTHSLKVAQVARSIAESLLSKPHHHGMITTLGGLDADVVEAAALAHDLGHPPYGHIGEVVLDRFARDHLGLPEGFEGNAQTLRILATLEPRSSQPNGMDVTAATMAGVLKYPWLRSAGTVSNTDDPPKFGYYSEEAEAFARARAWLPASYGDREAQTLEASIMDVADDITYALHDLEDYRFAGLVSTVAVRSELNAWLERYASRLKEGETVDDEDTTFGALRKRLTQDPAYNTEDFIAAVYAALGHLKLLNDPQSRHWRITQENSRRFISNQITQYIDHLELSVTPTRANPSLRLNVEDWHVVQILKQVTRYFVIGRADVAAVQRGQQRRLTELLTMLNAWVSDDRDLRRAAPELQELWQRHGARGLLDYVAGLTDDRATVLHATLIGDEVQTVVTGLAL